MGNFNVTVSGRNYVAGVGTVLPLRCDELGRLENAPPKVIAVEFTSAGAGAYTAGDVVGVATLLQNAAPEANASGFVAVPLVSLMLVDTAGQGKACTVYFFQVDPTGLAGATFADNAPLVWGTQSYLQLVGQVDLQDADWVVLAGKASANVWTGPALKLTTGGTDLYAVVVTKGTPTYGAGGKIEGYFAFGR